jgi:hypothetical protein
MRSFIRLPLAGIIAATAGLSLTQVAQAAQVTQAGPEAAVPGSIKVPGGNKVFLVGHGVGVQIYSCNASPSGFSWHFIAPRANLYDSHRKLIITHYAGPTWQAKDGSKVVGRTDASVTVNASAIPWLRLSPASKAAGPHGRELVATTYVQRIATKGGIAPRAAECSRATAGKKADVPYTADYYFWKKSGA